MTAPTGIDDVCYCTREDVKAALDVQETARSNRQIDRLIKSASRSIEGQTNRYFYPTLKSVVRDWPGLSSDNGAFPWRIWLDTQSTEVISLTSFTSGGVLIPASNYLLEPANDGPPYDHVDINLGTNSALGSASTWQQSQVFTGIFGYTANTVPAGTLATALTDTTGTTVLISDSSLVGVGSILMVDSERMQVTARTMNSTGQTLQQPMTADKTSQILAVTDGTQYDLDEVLLLDAERMLVTDIGGNNLIVKRAVDGTALAEHTGSTVYALRQLTVVRGVLGTTAAAHVLSTPLTVHDVPATVRTLAVAETIVAMEQEKTAFTRTVGSGENVRNANLAGLIDLRNAVAQRYGRNTRIGVI